MRSADQRSRAHVRYAGSRAKVPFCWVCNRRLWANGRVYAEVIDESGNRHPAHKDCAKEQTPEVTVQPKEFQS